MNPLFQFNVDSDATICVSHEVTSGAKYILYRETGDGFIPFSRDGQLLYLGYSNTCEIVPAGNYWLINANGANACPMPEGSFLVTTKQPDITVHESSEWMIEVDSTNCCCTTGRLFLLKKVGETTELFLYQDNTLVKSTTDKQLIPYALLDSIAVDCSDAEQCRRIADTDISDWTTQLNNLYQIDTLRTNSSLVFDSFGGTLNEVLADGRSRVVAQLMMVTGVDEVLGWMFPPNG